jgi:hypothetical protein
MANIQDLSDLINRSSGGASGAPESIFFYKVARVGGAAAAAPAAGRTHSLWRYDGFPAGGSTPGAAEIPTKDTAGAIPFTNASAGFEKWMTQIASTGLNAGTLILYDRIFQEGGFNATATGDQTVQGDPPSPAITRNVSGVGNIMFAEIGTIIGTTSVNLSAEYVDDLGNTASSTVNIGATGFREANLARIIPFAAGDRGVRAVKKIRLSGTTGTAGAFSIVIGKPIAWIPIGVAGGAGWRDYSTGLPTIPKIEDDACLAFLWVSSTTTAPEIFGALSMIQA